MRSTSKVIALLFIATLPLYAGTGEWIAGFGVGIGIQIIPWTRNHVVIPTVKKVQRTVRPIPQDKIEQQQKKEAKVRKKLHASQ